MKTLLASLSVGTAALAACATLWAELRTAPAPSAAPPAQGATGAPTQDPERRPGEPLRSRSPHLLEAAADDVSLRVTPVVKAVQRAADSVVNIYVIDRRRAQAEGPLRADGQGSGVILDDSGLVITNWHVVTYVVSQPQRYRVRVRLKNEREYEARVISASARDDLALLNLDLQGESVQPIVLGDSDSLMVGETVIAIGNPQGHANTVTVGVFSGEGRSITVRAPDGSVRRYSGLLQTDAAINQGNSGGALLDITGKLIGINNAMAVGAENIGFALPVNTVKKVFRDVLLSSENLANVWLGMRVRDEAGAVLVAAVEANGPAARAGIRQGDRIERVDGDRVESAIDYARRVIDARPGEGLRIVVGRGEKRLRATPVPLSTAGRELVRRVGIEVETVTAQADVELVRRASRAFYAGGRRIRLLPSVVRVQRVYPGGPADDLGLAAGDVLLGFRYSDGWFDTRDLPFTSEQDLADKVRAYAGRRMMVFVLRGERDMEGTLYVKR